MKTLTKRDIIPGFVAELRGIDLASHAWSEDLIDDIGATMNNYGVTILPGQHLDDSQFMDFVGRFGDIAMTKGNKARKNVAPPGMAEISNLGPDGELLPPRDPTQQYSDGNKLWHIDLSFTDHGAHQSFLIAREVPSAGGETDFASTALGYDALPDDLKARIDDLEVLHSLRFSRAKSGFQATENDSGGVFPPAYAHRLVRTHPVTGRKSLFVGSHSGAINGMEAAEGRALLEELLEYATRPEHFYRHRWAVGDLVIWDNDSVLHRRGTEYDPHQRRSMRRVTLRGDLGSAVAIEAGVEAPEYA